MPKTQRRLQTLPAVVLAQAAGTPFQIPDIGGSVGLGTADLKTTIINIVSWALGALALAAVVMVILGGFQWLTSAGDEERIGLAKKTISSAVIGMIIVLIAWAIVTFVINTTINVTQ